ncbi:MAG: hypothetical protein ACTH7X_08645 [Brevibacterium aurantiacum]
MSSNESGRKVKINISLTKNAATPFSELSNIASDLVDGLESDRYHLGRVMVSSDTDSALVRATIEAPLHDASSIVAEVAIVCVKYRFSIDEIAISSAPVEVPF